MIRCRFIVSQLIISLVLFASCSNANPDITTVTGSVVFDYADTESYPSVRLAVFAQNTAEVQRADRLEARHIESNLVWKVKNPRIFAGSNKQYAGYTNLLPREGETIPQGAYDFLYVDAAGNEDTGRFMISYPEELLTSKSSEARKFITKTVSDNLAIYDENGMLIFFNKRKKNWKTNSDIEREMRNAFTVRQCLNTTDQSIICLMPPQSLKDSSQETAHE